ncbi:MAG: MATE family efflux transporter [Ruminococcaceae bacterium]|nr:MATE family efflux transporter [Oscillospiraceae bacterium]
MAINKFIGTRSFYKKLLAVMIPILVQNAITNFISLLDNIMVGQVGTEQMSGVSIVNQLIFVFNLCIFGTISGAGLFSAQFFGKGDHDGVRHTFRFKLYVSVAVLAVALTLFITCGEPLISLYLHEGSETGDLALTLKYAKQYLAIMLIGLVPFTITQTYAGTLREIGHTVPPMIAGIVGVAVNLSLNYVLIFGKLGAPALGVEGAAIATIASRFVECIAIIIWAHTHKSKCEFIRGVYRSLRVPLPLVRAITKKGFPLLLNETLWAAAQATLLQCYSVRGIAVVSALNITNTIFNTFSVLFLSVGSAIALMLGHILGTGDTEGAKDAARKMIAFSLVMGAVCGAFVAICAPFFPLIYNTSAEVRGLATSLTFVIAAAAPLHAYLNASYFTMRSGGKTLTVFMFDSVYAWVVNVLLAFVLANFTSLPILTVYICCQGIDILKGVLGTYLVARGQWAVDLTKKIN